MKGLLSTPFHRVYFQDQTEDIERLPNSRLKIPVAVRLNIFPVDNLILRLYYRYYFDDFGINAHMVSLETPIKINNTWTVSPFYRFHTQTGSKYFAPYATHLGTEAFYSSDYDLSELNSQKYGIGIKYAPVYGIARAKIPVAEKLFHFKYIQVRFAEYQRSTGLRGLSVGLDLAFGIK